VPDELECWAASSPYNVKRISGVEDDSEIPLARVLCSSSFFIPGNGNSFESLYFIKSAVEAGGIGDTPPRDAVCGESDSTDADADCCKGC
jgi:hypothetical protein